MNGINLMTRVLQSSVLVIYREKHSVVDKVMMDGVTISFQLMLIFYFMKYRNSNRRLFDNRISQWVKTMQIENNPFDQQPYKTSTDHNKKWIE